MRSPVGRLGAKLVAFARLFRKPKGGPYSPDADKLPAVQPAAMALTPAQYARRAGAARASPGTACRTAGQDSRVAEPDRSSGTVGGTGP